jgi:hypothetical protein
MFKQVDDFFDDAVDVRERPKVNFQHWDQSFEKKSDIVLGNDYSTPSSFVII